MKKIFVSTVIIVSFVLYAIFHKQTNSISSLPGYKQTTSGTSQSVFVPPGSTSNDGTAIPSDTAPSQYKNGEYTGSAVDAYYGNIQVKAVVQHGRLVDIQFLQYPNNQHESREINYFAMPLLTQEAIAAQSAHVDIVTRATDSSLAFRQSLADALSQAK
jgi:uncharacterized protein with FMN-binding domain